MDRGPYGVDVLLDAIVERRRWAWAAPELDEHWTGREQALRAAFEASPDRGDPPSSPDVVDDVLEQTLERMLGLSGPMDAFLELPAELHDLHRRACALLDEPRAAYCADLRRFAVEVLALALGVGADAVVTRQEVIAAAGFDPAVVGPDPDDLL